MINNICAFKCSSTNVDSVVQKLDPTGRPDLLTTQPRDVLPMGPNPFHETNDTLPYIYIYIYIYIPQTKTARQGRGS
jgi:hypothetical protein